MVARRSGILAHGALIIGEAVIDRRRGVCSFSC
jgi:hypothetical protein